MSDQVEVQVCKAERNFVSIVVHETQVPEVEKLVAKLNRKAKRAGVNPVEIIARLEEPREVAQEVDGEEITFAVPYIRLDIEYDVIAYNGDFRVVGWIEPSGVGNQCFVHVAPGAEVTEDQLSDFREHDMTCDHCGTKRRRKSVILVENRKEEGWPIYTVGKSCLEHFAGIDPKAALAWTDFEKAFKALADQQAANDKEYGTIDKMALVKRVGLPVRRVVEAACTVNRSHQNYIDHNTKNRVWFLANPFERSRINYVQTDVDQFLADQILRYLDLLNIEDTELTDASHKAALSARVGYVKLNNLPGFIQGLEAARKAIVAQRPWLQAEKAEKAEKAPKGIPVADKHFLGEAGEEVEDLKVVVDEVIEKSGYAIVRCKTAFGGKKVVFFIGTIDIKQYDLLFEGSNTRSNFPLLVSGKITDREVWSPPSRHYIKVRTTKLGKVKIVDPLK